MNNSYDIQTGTVEEKKGTCWERRTKLEKKLILIASALSAAAIVLVTVFAVFLSRPETTCLSSSCIQTADELLEYMDLDVSPCDDFYRFACGNFLDNAVLEESESKDVADFLARNVYSRTRRILEQPLTETEPKPLTLAKKFYRACTNETAIEEKGLRLMKDALRQIGGWPALEGGSWPLEKFDWKVATYRLRELGFGFEFFIVLDIGIDKSDPTKHTIEIHSPFSPLHQIPEEGEDYFHSYMVNLSVAFGAERNRARNDFRDVINFKRSLFLDEDYDEKYEVLTISELKNKFFDIPWLEYINKMLYPAATINYQQFVTLYTPRYFARLQNAFRRTPKRVIANYISWRTVRNNREYLPKSISNIKWMLYTKGEENLSHSKMCFKLTYENFDLTLESSYAQKYLSPELKSDVAGILGSLKTQLKDTVRDLDWIDAETTAKASERISSTLDRVAYADELMQSSGINSEYLGAQVKEDDFLASILNIRFHATNHRFKKLHEPVTDELEDGYVMHNSAYYYDKEHTITVPGRILQNVIYDPNRPKCLNYGSLGSQLGHELSHIVFDLNANNKDKTENVLSMDTKVQLNEKLSCIMIHYGKYRVPEVEEYLNSSNTKHEDFADIIGAKLAYQAYQAWENGNGPEQKLPGFDYTSKQLFWISFAVRFCEKSTPEWLQYKISHSMGSPKRYRVLGVLRNSEEFARDFNCPAGSFMNAEDKCQLS